VCDVVGDCECVVLLISDIVCECVCTSLSHTNLYVPRVTSSPTMPTPTPCSGGTIRENLDKLERDIHEKGIPLMKTWRYMHSQFPDTLLYKDCRMGLLEVNTGFRFNIDFKTEEREPVKEIMSKLPPMTSSV